MYEVLCLTLQSGGHFSHLKDDLQDHPKMTPKMTPRSPSKMTTSCVSVVVVIMCYVVSCLNFRTPAFIHVGVCYPEVETIYVYTHRYVYVDVCM